MYVNNKRIYRHKMTEVLQGRAIFSNVYTERVKKTRQYEIA
jgi:hypothetical protein